jgi:hypothetical protein
MNLEVEAELRAIHAKLDQLLAAVEEIRGAKRAANEAKKAKLEKLPPPTAESVQSFQSKFSILFERWLAGEEIEVQNDLEGLDVETLRRFADANNLNVTKKMSAQKLLQLIAARFREKRQLTVRERNLRQSRD